MGIFGMVWLLVQANWVKKVTRNARPFAWCLAHLLTLATLYLLAFTVGIVGGMTHQANLVQPVIALVIPLFQIALLVVYIVASFSLKGALEAEPIDIPLGGIMTFFFAPIYFQYHLFDYSVEGKVGEQLSGFGDAAPAVAELPPQA
jgi:hypothetical protein